jgi:hypothetical protein
VHHDDHHAAPVHHDDHHAAPVHHDDHHAAPVHHDNAHESDSHSDFQTHIRDQIHSLESALSKARKDLNDDEAKEKNELSGSVHSDNLDSEALLIEETIKHDEHESALQLEAEKRVMESLYAEEQKENHQIDALEQKIEHQEAVRAKVHEHLQHEERVVQAGIDREIVLHKEEKAVESLATHK